MSKITCSQPKLKIKLNKIALDKLKINHHPKRRIENEFFDNLREYMRIGIKINNLLTYKIDDKEYTTEGNNNSAGNTIETVIKNYMIRDHKCLNGPLQSSPDLFFRGENNVMHELEIKAYEKTANFDIANYRSYIDQLVKEGGVERKIYNTFYVVARYKISRTDIIVTDINLYRTWEILGYDGKYPITIQRKKGTWCNIRPQLSYNNKNPDKCISSLIQSIHNAPPFTHNEGLTSEGAHFCNIIKSQYDVLQSTD